jgi:O-antigen/teichoic acid export membrane protein
MKLPQSLRTTRVVQRFRALAGSGVSGESRLVRGTAWTAIGTSSAQGLAFIAAVFAARIIGPVGYGEYGMILSTVGMFGVFAGPGLTTTAARFISERRTSHPEQLPALVRFLTRISFYSAAAAAAALALIAGWLCRESLNAPQLTTAVRWSAGLLFLLVVNGTQTGLLTGFERFRALSRINVLRGALTLPLMLVGVWFWKVEGLVAAALLANVGVWIGSEITLKRTYAEHGVRPAGRLPAGEAHDMLFRFALPSVLGGLFVIPVYWIVNRWLIQQPGGFAELGMLNAANQWKTVILFLPTIIMQVTLPLLSSTSGGSDRPAFDRLLLAAQNSSILIVFPISALVMFGATWAMHLYGRDFAAGATTLVWSLSAVMIMSIGAAVGSALQARSRMWIGFFINVGWALITLLVSALLIRSWGAAGCACAVAVAYGGSTVWSFLVMRRQLPPGVVSRMFAALGVAGTLPLAALVTPEAQRVYYALPAFVLTSGIAYYLLVDRSFRTLLSGRIRGLRAATGGDVS